MFWFLVIASNHEPGKKKQGVSCFFEFRTKKHKENQENFWV